jgi:5-methylcytosine-specific restriction endonuclease McrA
MPVCLCPDGRALDRKLRGKESPWAPTIDHIVLKTLGGSDRMDNMRAAHRLCNLKDLAAVRMSLLRSREGRRW